MGDFSRKKSIIISPSSTAMPGHMFEFDRLVELNYQGKIIGGRKVGRGTAKYEGRLSYDGEFARGVREGNGTLRFNN
jgi:hypothetical protein